MHECGINCYNYLDIIVSKNGELFERCHAMVFRTQLIVKLIDTFLKD